MKSVLLISERSEMVERFRRFLSQEYSVFVAGKEEALEFLSMASADVAVVDLFDGKGFSLLEEIQEGPFRCGFIGLMASDAEIWEGREDLLAVCDFLLKEPSSRPEVQAAVKGAMEKQRLLQEVRALRSRVSSLPQKSSEGVGGANHLNSRSKRSTTPSELNSSPPALEQVLKGFAKSLSAGFDLDRLLNQFLEAVIEMVRPSKVSILVLEDPSGAYRIGAYRGLPPKLMEGLRLKSKEGLALWLAREGRIIRRQDVEEGLSDPLLLEVDRELGILQAIVGIPLMARGSLIGILSLGHRVTGRPYTDAELEILFTLSGHAAVAVQDIRLYQHAQYQKTYIEHILARMSSGVINIDRDGKVVIFNHRAEEILGMKVSEILNRDLRGLPSPLGDMLFEALRTESTYRRHEVQILPERIPLEVSTYRLSGEKGEALGSVMILDDLSSRKQLEEERTRSERLGVLDRVVGWTAHEIKNALVSIRAFIELLPERYEDPEFRERFGSMVRQGVESLDELVGKLATLADTVEYHYGMEEINPLLEEWTSEFRGKELLKGVELVSKLQEGLPKIRCDRDQLRRAFCYLLGYLARSVPSGDNTVTLSTSSRPEGGVEIRISSTALDLSEEKLDRIFDPFDRGAVSDLELCVSRRIVEGHRGEISAERGRRGRGVSFHIRLPEEWSDGVME